MPMYTKPNKPPMPKKTKFLARPETNGILANYGRFDAAYDVFGEEMTLDAVFENGDYCEVESTHAAFIKAIPSLEKKYGHLYCRLHSRLLDSDGACDVCNTGVDKLKSIQHPKRKE